MSIRIIRLFFWLFGGFSDASRVRRVLRFCKIAQASPGLCEKILGGRIRNEFGLFPTVSADSHTHCLENQTVHRKPRRSIHPNPKTTQNQPQKTQKVKTYNLGGGSSPRGGGGRVWLNQFMNYLINKLIN